jgi:protein gp37
VSQGTGIQWTQATWNPLSGCTPVSPGCLNCYAATMAHRLAAMGQEKYAGLTVEKPGPGGTTRHVFNGVVRLEEDALGEPLRRRLPTTWFVNSMSDLFHEKVPVEYIVKVLAVAAMKPEHVFQILTKRPERMAEVMNFRGLRGLILEAAEAMYYGVAPTVKEARARVVWRQVLDARAGSWPLPNVHLGTSCEDQARADERVPHLLRCPAAVRFLSCEPLLGAIDLRLAPMKLPEDVRPVWERIAAMADEPRIDWAIVGGESGALDKIRPCNLAWVRSIVAQCRAVGVPVFVKQLGSGPFSVDEERKHAWGRVAVSAHALAFDGWTLDSTRLKDAKGGDPAEWPEDLRVREMPAGAGGAP